jgi:hypothetical protein
MIYFKLVIYFIKKLLKNYKNLLKLLNSKDDMPLIYIFK